MPQSKTRLIPILTAAAAIGAAAHMGVAAAWAVVLTGVLSLSWTHQGRRRVARARI